MKMFRSCALLFGVATMGLMAAHGQAIPAATQPGVLTVGIDGSVAKTDEFYEPKSQLEGIGIFADYQLGEHLSLAADVHIMEVVTPDDFGENSYLVGARYNFHYSRFTPYAKVELGIGTTFVTEDYQVGHIPGTPGKYFAIALGGGTDIKIKGHWIAHVDAEYQDWPGFGAHGLNPAVGSIGIGYRFRP